MQPTIAFRVDWSRQRGLGHLQRCLSLAEALSLREVQSLLVARPGPTAASPDVADVKVHWLPGGEVATGPIVAHPGSAESGWTQQEDASSSIETIRKVGAKAVVVDVYELDALWESRVRDELGIPVVAIDGLADRAHTAELVIDPTYVADDRSRWDGLVETNTRVLRGPRYAVLSPRFQEQLSHRPERDGTVRRVLVSFGGSDPQGLTERALEAIETLDDLGLVLDVVVGAGHAAPEKVQERCARMRAAEFHRATSHMAELMAAADLAIGSGGITTYERAFLGLPALVVVAADNQVAQVREVARAGAIVALGTAASVSAPDLAAALHEIATDPIRVRRMSAAAREIMGNDMIPGSIRLAEEVARLL